MNKPILKFAIGIAALLIAMGGSYVLLNTGYFWKQLQFKFNPPSTDQNNSQTSEQKMEPNRIEIPSLGISAPIVEAAVKTEAGFQEALKTGVVHYPGTANVGEVGNAYLFGHSSDFAFKGGSFKTVFALLPQIKDGAEILVSDAQGNRFKYKVFKQFVAKSTDTSLLSQNTDHQKRLTLQTSYPIGTALQRYIVVSEFIE
jgi:LPXTG-site transpeptidase (sortase) family protein